jgi:hypothetical protein
MTHPKITVTIKDAIDMHVKGSQTHERPGLLLTPVPLPFGMPIDP